MTHTEVVWQGITALVTILTVVAAYLKTRSASKVAHVETAAKLDTVQELVNGQTDALHAHIDALTKTIADAGLDVPKQPGKAG